MKLLFVLNAWFYRLKEAKFQCGYCFLVVNREEWVMKRAFLWCSYRVWVKAQGSVEAYILSWVWYFCWMESRNIRQHESIMRVWESMFSLLERQAAGLIEWRKITHPHFILYYPMWDCGDYTYIQIWLSQDHNETTT